MGTEIMNGQYHGKRKFGIKITNPLTLAVSVIIKSPTGSLHTGDGKETWRTIKPGETLYIPTKGRCEVDINPAVVRYDEVGSPIKLGDAGFRSVLAKKTPKTPPEHVPERKKRIEPEELPLLSLGEMIEEMRKEEVKV